MIATISAPSNDRFKEVRSAALLLSVMLVSEPINFNCIKCMAAHVINLKSLKEAADEGSSLVDSRLE
jgi:hypothetical protein